MKMKVKVKLKKMKSLAGIWLAVSITIFSKGCIEQEHMDN